MDQKEKGDKILKDPKAPKFLHSHMDKLNALWADANKCAESRLKQLKGMYTSEIILHSFWSIPTTSPVSKIIYDYQF